MTESTFMWIIGGLQGVNLLLLGWVKLDIRDIWKRVNNHGHTIDCDGAGCKPKTSGVIVKERD